MTLKMFSVFDSKAEAFITPFFAQARGVAIRMFMEAAQDRDHAFFKHSADYTLFDLGEFDQVTGMFKPEPAPVSLGTAIQFQAPQLSAVPAGEE